jgi:hypothetical protein
VCANFEELFIHCDVVYFEFCLHEIVDPRRALGHARSLAPDIVLIDHSRDSEWAFYAEEEEKSLRSWAAVQKFLIRRREGHCAEQRFRNYSELATKTEAQGKTVIERSLRFADRTNIVIPMRYELTLL